MVFDATRIASTCESPCDERCTARTILFTSTGSSAPLRLRTCMTGISSRTGKSGVRSERLRCKLIGSEGVAIKPPGLKKLAKKQRERRPEKRADRCHLASPRRRERYFPGRSSDSTGSNLLTRLPRPLRTQCHRRRSYLLTAAGQFRTLTGFPFHPPTQRRPWNEPHYILFSSKHSSRSIVDIMSLFKLLAPTPSCRR